MFIKTYQGWQQEDTKTTRLKCDNCGNTTEHYVRVEPVGLQLGLIFIKKPLLSCKRYFLTCPTCEYLTTEITKNQAYAMRQ